MFFGGCFGPVLVLMQDGVVTTLALGALCFLLAAGCNMAFEEAVEANALRKNKLPLVLVCLLSEFPAVVKVMPAFVTCWAFWSFLFYG